MKFKKSVIAGVLSSTLFLGGCANHLRNTERITQEEEKNVLKTKYELKLSPETIKDTYYHIDIQRFASVSVKKYDVQVVKSISTPYQWWREFYEMPAGLGLLPVSIGSHLLFIFSFGILPYDVPRSINELSFAGMNPMLNWENEERTEENLVSLNRKMLNHTVVNTQTPLTKQPVIVRAGGVERKYVTDDFGNFSLSFLSHKPADTFFPQGRKVTFELGAKKGMVLKDVILTRDFLSKLTWARTKINAYRMNPSGKLLFDTVIFLEKNGFEKLAYFLEESELEKNKYNHKFHSDFQSAAQQ